MEMVTLKPMEKRSECLRREIRASADGKKLFIRGYPILFNTPTKIWDFFDGEITETILPTALDGTRLDNVYLLVGHNADNVLGRVGINVRVEIDEIGLFFECELPNTQLARDWYNLVEPGIVDGMSFGFMTSDQVNYETMTRTITHIDELIEITITPFPAYKEASVVAKRKAELNQETPSSLPEKREEEEVEEVVTHEEAKFEGEEKAPEQPAMVEEGAQPEPEVAKPNEGEEKNEVAEEEERVKAEEKAQLERKLKELEEL